MSEMDLIRLLSPLGSAGLITIVVVWFLRLVPNMMTQFRESLERQEQEHVRSLESMQARQLEAIRSLSEAIHEQSTLLTQIAQIIQRCHDKIKP